MADRDVPRMRGSVESQRRLILHGSFVLLVALSYGIPSVIEVSAGSGRMWQAAHSALLVLGIWMIATAAVVPVLALREPEASGLRWSLMAAGYSFMTAVTLQAVTGTRAFSPDGGVVQTIAFVANLVAVLSSFLAAGLTLIGALNALWETRRSEAEADHPRRTTIEG